MYRRRGKKIFKKIKGQWVKKATLKTIEKAKIYRAAIFKAIHK